MKHNRQEFRHLLDRVRDGSQGAAYELNRVYQDLVFRVVRRRLPQKLRRAFDSHDFAQVVWASIFRRKSRLPRFDSADQFRKYLAAVAANKVGLERRRRLLQKKHNMNRECSLSAPSVQSSSAEPAPHEVAIARERWFRMLEELSPRHQAVIKLRCEGHKFREIAGLVGLDEGSVRRIVRKTRSALED